ncbi:RHS repeat-associated core domain-containing protein, partial [Pseudomonas syringae]
ARSAVEAKYKTVRYSGKERDASGLYYYGFRYYAPWLQRWINPDPAGDVDGLNLFCFSRNTPTLLVDRTGFSPFDFNKVLNQLNAQGDPVQAVGIENTTHLNPAFGGTLAVALASSKKGLAFARQKINYIKFGLATAEEKETVLGYFRNPDESNAEVDAKILSASSLVMGKLTAFVQKYDGKKIVSVGGPRESQTTAWQYTEDPEHHIFMRENVANKSPNTAAWNIIHEASHIALRTQDSWYINVPGSTEESASGSASYSGRIDILSHVQKLQKRFSGYIWDGPDAAEVDSITFEKNPLSRTEAILNNADSLSLLTSFINQRFNGPLARLTMTHSRPSEMPALDLASRPEQRRVVQRRLSNG